MDKERGIDPFDSGGTPVSSKEKVERAVNHLIWLGSGGVTLAGMIADNANIVRFGAAWLVTHLAWSVGTNLHRRIREFNP